MKNSILETLSDASVRMDQCFLLAGALASGDALPNGLSDFFEETDQSILEALFGKKPCWVDFKNEQTVIDWLLEEQKYGFLVNFSTPVMKPIGAGSRAYSWGRVYVLWVYETWLDDAILKSIAWAGQMRAREAEKAQQQGGAA